MLWFKIRLAFGAVLAVCLALPSHADILHMKDGREVEGQVVEENKATVKIRTVVGTLEFKASEIDHIERTKSKLVEFDERFEEAKSGDDYHQLGLWAAKKRMRKHAKTAMLKAVEVEPTHEPSNTWLGFVLHDGKWMTPEERAKQILAAEDAEQFKKGLVRYGDRWVTLANKLRLEQGLIQVDGKWMSPEDAKRAQGLELFEGLWVDRSEALARANARHAEELAEAPFALHLTSEALLAGTVPIKLLEQVGERLVVGRNWFNREMAAAPGLTLLAERRAEFYLFDTRAEHYERTVEYFASLTKTLPEGWTTSAKKTYGFFWSDPYAMSSARQWHRGQEDLAGHCYHHWGHMLLCRLGYDGRLLPPWYEEAFASWTEFNIHGKNKVFCRARTTLGIGTVSGRTKRLFDPNMVRDGRWREALKIGIREKQVYSIDKLYQLDYSDMQVLDIATGMGILEWIASHGPEALGKFHGIYRGAALDAPARLVAPTQERHAANDLAFKAATGMGWREADRTWQMWFMEQ